MTTSWTASDIAALEAAIKVGARVVQFSDGRKIERYSLPEMMDLLRTMREEVAGETTGSTRTTHVVTRKG